MSDYFVLNGENSLDIGIHISNLPTITRSTIRNERNIIAGRNGTTRTSDETQEDKVKTVGGYFQGEPDLFFNFIKPGEITFSNQLDRYFTCDVDNEIILNPLFDDWYEFSITFVLNPLSYLYDGDETITLTEPSAIVGNGNVNSNPYIKVIGNGTITLTINSESITLNNVDGYIELDSEEQECFKDGVRKNRQMIGEFPTLNTSSNTISWSGRVTKIEIIPRWRCS